MFINNKSDLCCCIFKGLLIQCACTTAECHNQRTNTCITHVMCFTQFLDRQDGSASLLRGCIDRGTPILCDNMRPAAVPIHKWPILFCCQQDMCNERVVPTFPSWYTDTISKSKTRKIHFSSHYFSLAPPFFY